MSSVHEPPRPDFFVIGVPKAGTTTLYEHLRSHPEVRMSQPKEPHYFDVNYEKEVKRYWSDHFAEARDGDVLTGEATPHYLFVPYVARRISRVAPEATLIAVLRDPIERAYSDWWMYWTRGTEPETFGKAIASNLERLRTGPSFLKKDAEALWVKYYRQTISGTPSRIRYRPYVELGHYAEQLDRYTDYFSEDQIRIILFDDLREEPGRVLLELRSCLGLAETGSMGAEYHANVGLGGLLRPVYRSARALGLEPLLHELPDKLKRWLKRTSAVVSPRPPIPEEPRARLADHYAPRIRRLEGMIERDLSGWLEE